MRFDEELGIRNEELKTILPERVANLADAVLQFIALAERESKNETK
jgi:hypothetical protein